MNLTHPHEKLLVPPPTKLVFAFHITCTDGYLGKSLLSAKFQVTK